MDRDTVEETSLPDYRTYTSMSLEGEAAVGRIAIWAAWLELTLAHFCSALIGARNGVGTTLTEGMTASQLIQMSKRLTTSYFSTLPEDLQERAVKALATAKQALEQRNRILHGPVGGSLEPNTTAFYSRRLNAKGLLDAAVHSPDELDAMGANLHAAMEELDDLMGEIEKAISQSK